MRQLDDSNEYETLLLPEDEGEANRFLFGTDDPEMLAEGNLDGISSFLHLYLAKEQHKLALKHGTEDPKLIKEGDFHPFVNPFQIFSSGRRAKSYWRRKFKKLINSLHSLNNPYSMIFRTI